MRFFKSSIWSFAAVVVRAICSLFIVKYFAVQFGQTGISLLAHFQNLVSIPTVISNEGVAKGVVKFISQEKDPTIQRTFFMTGLLSNIVLFMLFSLSLIFGKRFILDYFVSEMVFWKWLVCFLIPVCFLLFNTLVLSIALAKEYIRYYAVISISTSLFGCVLLYTLGVFSVYQSLILYHWANAFAFLVSCAFLYKKIPVHRFFIWKIPPCIFFKKLSWFVVVALSLAVFDKVASFFFREYIIESLGYYQTGLWQTLIKLSTSYTQVFMATFLVLFFPKVSKIIHDKVRLSSFLTQTIPPLILVAVLGLTLVFVLKDWLLVWMFDDSFLAASYLVGYQVIGDFFKFANYFLGHLILAQSRMKLYTILQIVFNSQYFVIAYFFSHFWGIKGLVLAMLTSYAISVVVLLIAVLYNKK